MWLTTTFLALLIIYGETINGFNLLTRKNTSEFIKSIKTNDSNYEKSIQRFIELLNNSNHVMESTLPESLIPERYYVSLKPDAKNLKFDGHVRIFGQISNDIDDKNIISFNADELNISHVNLYDLTNNRNLTIASTALFEKISQFTIKLEENLKYDTDYELSMEFSGKIRSSQGLYIGTYSGRPESPVLMTELQPIYARNLFPCWDEPQYKARFTISVERESKQVAISNMPLNFTSKSEERDDKVWDTFEETPPMSTYIVALVVAELNVIKDYEQNIRIWTEPGKEETGWYALNISKSILEILEQYTDYKYSLPKLDQVALPNLVFEGMENWGLITYQDKHLLVEQEDDLLDKQDVAVHISHEIAHQWFGNLVTTRWWNNVWLNEGFAQFFEYFILDLLEPDWQMVESFVINEFQFILKKDSYLNTHALSMKNIETSDAIRNMFDNICYLKGGSIVRMLYHIMTPELFRTGLNHYLVNNSLSSVTVDDLWDSFREVETSELDLPVDIEELMESWVYNEGYPLLEIYRNTSSSPHSITLSQKRFFNNEMDSETRKTNNHKWWIPLSYTTSEDTDFEDTEAKEWFDPSTDEHHLSVNLEEDEWIIFNIQLSGFYRVNYDNITWNLIITDMVEYGFTEIHPLNRAELIDDAYHLSLSGNIDIEIFMELTKYLMFETDAIPWSTALTVFRELDNNLLGTPAQPLLYKYIQHLISCWYNEIGFYEKENETDKMKLNRMILLDVACSFGHEDCQERALENVYLMMSQADVRLPKNLEGILLCIAVEEGPSEVWQYIRKRYIEADIHSNREALLDAMACSNDTVIIIQMLKDSIQNDSYLTKNDAYHLVGNLITETDPNNLDLILDFFSNNLDQILITNGESKVITYFFRLAIKLNQNISKIYDFLDKHENKLKNLIPAIKSKLKFISHTSLKEEYYNKLYDWLKREEITFNKELTDDYEASESDEEDLYETTTTTTTLGINDHKITENYTIDDYDSMSNSTKNIIELSQTDNITDKNIHNSLEETATEINKKILTTTPGILEPERTNSFSVQNSKTRFFNHFIKISTMFLVVFIII